MDAVVLLSGPRGRRLCWEVLLHAPSITGSGDTTARSPLPVDAAELVAGSARAALRQADLGSLRQVGEPALLLPALAASVDSARYWQEPDETDQALRNPDLQELLLPVAEAVLDSPAASWWDEPARPQEQYRTAEHHDNEQPPEGPDPYAELADWRRGTVQDEERAARERPADPTAACSGRWWSSPALTKLVSTSGALPGSDVPAGLVLVEDGTGAHRMHVQPVTVDAAARVYEVTCPEDWSLLVAAHPLEVTSSRRHDWWRATGWSGRWAIPDWAAVAGRWDGVHVTVNGYLAAAGLPLRPPSDDGVRTLLAGWNPGTTWWLTRVARLGSAQTYRAHDEDLLRWAPESDQPDHR